MAVALKARMAAKRTRNAAQADVPAVKKPRATRSTRASNFHIALGTVPSQAQDSSALPRRNLRSHGVKGNKKEAPKPKVRRTTKVTQSSRPDKSKATSVDTKDDTASEQSDGDARQHDEQATIVEMEDIEIYMPPNSAGPIFEGPPDVDDDFMEVMKGETPDLRPGKPIGIQSDDNVSYRNAVLTALIHTRHFHTYLENWHDPKEYKGLAPVALNSLWILGRLQDIAHEAHSIEVDPNNRPGERVWHLVKQLWDQVCYPTNRSWGKLSNLPYGTWQQRTGVEKDKEADACKFLNWLLDSIEGQLGLEKQPGPVTWKDRFVWLLDPRQVVRSIFPTCRFPVRLRDKVVKEELIIDIIVPHTEEVDAENSGYKTTRFSFINVFDASMKQKTDRQCCRCGSAAMGACEEARLQQAPAVLIFTLDRARSRTKTIGKGKRAKTKQERFKNAVAMTIPQTLDLDQHLNAHEYGARSEVKYRLATVVAHTGDVPEKGRYLTYVRGADKPEQWYRVNGARVVACEASAFDDTDLTIYKDGKEFAERPTPVILIFEKDFEAELVTDGRDPMNVDETNNEDTKPSQWSGRERRPPEDSVDDDSEPLGSDTIVVNPHPQRPAVRTAESENSSSDGDVEEDDEMPEANLEMTLKIGDLEFSLPAQALAEFDTAQVRNIEIKASITTKKNGKDDMRIDLIETFLGQVPERNAEGEYQRKLDAKTARLRNQLRRIRNLTDRDLEIEVQAVKRKRLEKWKSNRWATRWEKLPGDDAEDDNPDKDESDDEEGVDESEAGE